MPKISLLGEILAKKGVITKEQLHQALLDQKKSNKKLGRVLIDLGFVSEEVMIDYLSGQMADILKECEESIPHLFKKPHELMRKKVPIQSIKDEKFEEEIYRRLDAGRKKLDKAKELFKKGMYDEVLSNAYYAMHHIRRVVHHLQEDHKHFEKIRKIGVTSVYTGRTGSAQVGRYNVFVEKISKEINLSTKHYAKSIIKDAESYLKKAEKFLYAKLDACSGSVEVIGTSAVSTATPSAQNSASLTFSHIIDVMALSPSLITGITLVPIKDSSLKEK